MRRLVTWIGGTVGGITAYRLLRRRPQVESAPEPGERAEELRAKLAESRAAEPVVDEPPPGPVAEEELAAEPEEHIEPESPDERRRRVHEEGRAALDDMTSDGAA